MQAHGVCFSLVVCSLICVLNILSHLLSPVLATDEVQAGPYDERTQTSACLADTKNIVRAHDRAGVAHEASI